MKNRVLSLMLLFFVMASSLSAKALATEASYAWVLVEVVDHENSEKWEQADAHESYAVSHSYGRGTYAASTTYEGDDLYRQGLSGTLAVQATYTGMPEIIYPDQPVTLRLSFGPTENSVEKLSFTASASADFDQWDVGPEGRTGSAVEFLNGEGESTFVITSDNDPSYEETLTATLGGGNEGSKIALRVKLSMGVAMGTNYIYEWKQVGEAENVSPAGSEPIPEEKSSPIEGEDVPSAEPEPIPEKRKFASIEDDFDFWVRWSEQAKKWTPEEIEEAKKCSGFVRMGDLWGECIVLRGWEEDIDQAILLDFDTPIYHGDLIITRNRSGAVLSFSDLSSFSMGESSAVILDIKEEKTSNFALLGGTIWTNLKRMWKDGSLDIEMSQAVAGIKGTTLVCEAYDGVSTLKVLEGAVEYTSTSTGEAVIVGSGETVDAAASGLSAVTTFDVEEEKNRWERAYQFVSNEEAEIEEPQNKIANDKTIEKEVKEKGIGILWIIIFILGALVLVAAIVVALIIKKQKPV